MPFDLRALRVIEFDVQDPEWSELLAGKIKQVMKEVLAAPEEAVPPPFLKEKKISGQPAVSADRKEILRLQQDMDRLRAELRSGGKTGEMISSPAEAEEILRDYFSRGVPTQMIIRRMDERGVPSTWTAQRLREITGRVKPVKRKSSRRRAPAKR